jgi:lipid-binding SYLF domain-containing protein
MLCGVALFLHEPTDDMRPPMKRMMHVFLAIAALMLPAAAAWADEYRDTIALFKNAGQSAAFFDKSYAFAVFPTIGKAGFVVGGAHGTGRVYRQGKHVGDTKMTQISVGLQAGALGYSEIIFLEDKRAFDEFTSGQFAFGASVGAVVITAAAGASASTSGSTAGASGGKNDATTVGGFQKGVAVFKIVKGGVMGDASVGGQKFSFTPVTATVVTH